MNLDMVAEANLALHDASGILAAASTTQNNEHPPYSATFHAYFISVHA